MSDRLNDYEAFGEIPLSERVYSNLVNWITIISSIGALFAPLYIMIFPDKNTLFPNKVFGTIFEGVDINGFWEAMGGKVDLVRIYLTNPAAPDSWAEFFVELGCSVGLWALIPTILIQLFREKNWLNGLLGTVLAALIALSMFGILG